MEVQFNFELDAFFLSNVPFRKNLSELCWNDLPTSPRPAPPLMAADIPVSSLWALSSWCGGYLI